MMFGLKEYHYIVSHRFDEKAMRAWPGVELLRDDGYTVRRGSPALGQDFFYVVLIYRPAMPARIPTSGGPYREPPAGPEPVARPIIQDPGPTHSDGDRVRAIMDALEAQIEAFWQSHNQDWPGLGPAGPAGAKP